MEQANEPSSETHTRKRSCGRKKSPKCSLTFCHARPKTAVDWYARDELVCGQVVTVALQIKNAPGKPQRISFATINREIRARLRVYIDTKQMPLTRLALQGVVETPEQFGLRRIQYVAKSFVAENAIPSRSDFLRAAGINPQRQISGMITDEIQSPHSCLLRFPVHIFIVHAARRLQDLPLEFTTSLHNKVGDSTIMLETESKISGTARQ